MGRVGNVWSIVLAGGEGTRMTRCVERWLGEARPKQYCAFSGRATMLEHTWRRAATVTTTERVVTVIGAGHRRYLEGREEPGLVIEQPRGCGTAAGVLLPAAVALAADPAATLVILPSDHFIWPNEAFAGRIEAACDVVARHPRLPVLLAARPSSAEPDFGWIEPGPTVAVAADGTAAARVRVFHEKPKANEALTYYARGFLWNTMIVAIRARTLWDLCHSLIPEVARRFEPLVARMRAAHRSEWSEAPVRRAIEAVYRGAPTRDLSRHVLQNLDGRALVMGLEEVRWSDWGRPERVAETLAPLGAESNVPASLLEAAPALTG